MQLVEQAPAAARRVRTPLLVAAGVLVVVVALVLVPWLAAESGRQAAPRRPSFPRTVGGWSSTASSVRRAPLGAAIALVGYGDSGQLAIGADGTDYRSVLGGHVFTGHTDGEGLLSPDGRSVAVGGIDDVLRLVRLDDGSVRSYRIHHARRVRALAFAPDGRRIVCAVTAVGSGPDSVILLDPKAGTSLLLVTGTARAAAFSPDGGSIAVQVGGDVQVAHSSGVLAGRLPDVGGVLAGPHAWSPDGRWLALTGTGGASVHFASTDPGSGDAPPAPLADRHARFVGWADAQTLLVTDRGALLRQPLAHAGTARRIGTLPAGAALDDVAITLIDSRHLTIARGAADYGPPPAWWLRTVIGAAALLVAALSIAGAIWYMRRRAAGAGASTGAQPG
ncbi:hypothetical protein Athai_18580 [Actinocatenispora thailandica]|uniref:WD40 repeat domain-containing protein n=1 Tax=Actinocatenispora thailandica TaxID=227318 RepID=A0A7R7DMN8_9ACTN|nr:PD40 domain-containing protein [Actinocatenispora thailandica]BCJ34355.1 hypothetical protein Athai_18580 [Actinocatenispora thailandica]